MRFLSAIDVRKNVECRWLVGEKKMRRRSRFSVTVREYVQEMFS